VVRAVNHTRRYLIVFVVIIGLMALLFTAIPKSFLPDEDQGILFAQVITPRARPRGAPRKRLAGSDRTIFSRRKAGGRGAFNRLCYKLPPVAASWCVIRATEAWADRPGARNRVQAVAARAERALPENRRCSGDCVRTPPVLELGNASGFDLELLDRERNR